MVSRFTLLAPWWARWLVSAAAFSATLAVLAAAMFPKFPTAAAWPWNAVAVVATGVALAAAPLIQQQPMRRAYTATLTGLDRRQQSLALTALRRNKIPSEPAVLAGAVRAVALNVAYLNALTNAQKAVRWWLPPLYVLMAGLQFLDHQLRMGLLFLGLALYLGVYFAVLAYRTKRLRPRVAQLRAAAAAVPEAEAALIETSGGVPRPPRRLWVMWILVAVFVAYYFLAEHFWVSYRRHETSPHDHCANVDRALQFVDEHPGMLDPERLPTGDPALSAYQDWSGQLHSFAEHEQDPELFRRLNTFDSLSAHAVAVVRDLRTHAGPASQTDVIRAHEIDYQTTISATMDQLNSATSECHSRH